MTNTNILMVIFPMNPGLPVPSVSSSTRSRKKPLGQPAQVFHGSDHSDALPATQLTVSNNLRKHKVLSLPATWHHIFTHHQTPQGRGVAPFTPTLQYCLSYMTQREKYHTSTSPCEGSDSAETITAEAKLQTSPVLYLNHYEDFCD